MGANIKTNIKREIAVGLIAIMAAVGPMQTLQPTGAAGIGAPAVAKAAETDKAPNFKGRYLFEVVARYDGSYRYAPSKRWAFRLWTLLFTFL